MSLAKFCRTIHAYLSIFFLPMALIYAITGICYICGYTGKSESVRYTAAIEASSPASPAAKDTLVKNILSANGIACPSGEGRELRNQYVLGRPTSRHAVLEPIRDGMKEAKVVVNTPDLFSRLVLLHKAKGGAPFNVFGIAFGVALLLIYVSGIFLFWASLKVRMRLTLCFAGGLVITVLVILASF